MWSLDITTPYSSAVEYDLAGEQNSRLKRRQMDPKHVELLLCRKPQADTYSAFLCSLYWMR